MTKAEENKYSMYISINAVLEANPRPVNSLPALLQLKNQLVTKISGIQDVNNSYTNLKLGKKESKDNAKTHLISELVPMADALYVFAKKNGNQEIMAVAKISESKLKSMRDTEPPDFAKVILDFITANAESLADYNITPEKITSLSVRIDEYRTSLNDQEHSYAFKTAERQKLNQLFIETDTLLRDEIDRVIEMFKVTQPEFFKEYKSARVIWDYAASRGSAKKEEEPAPANS